MSQDFPPLALDDLVHLMSPSPAPQPLLDDPDLPHRPRSASPEPLPESDVLQMRRKVAELRHSDKAHHQLTPRERELAEMVLRLTASARPDPEQLLRQANMISALIQQRDLLLHQYEEQRLRWNSEQDSWARMQEALLAQQAKNQSNSDRDEDYERLHTAESDNKGLRQRLHETQSRLQMLESELTRLRPLLLMQPLISRSPLPPPTPNPKTHHPRRRKKDVTATEDEDRGPSEDEPPIDPFDTPSNTSHAQATPKAKSRKSEAPNNHHPPVNPHKRRLSHKAVLRGLSADARVEHLLLAARRIGKQRTGIMSGMAQQLEDRERERERERKREESAMTAVASTPKTPKRHTGYPPPETGYVYLNNQIRPGPGIQPVPMFIPAYPHHLLQTPSSSTTAPSASPSTQQSSQKPKKDATTNNPPTPLDSLLSAARSMMHEDSNVEVNEDEEIDVVGDSPAKLAGTRHARPKDLLGSPVPKRRKLAARTDKLSALTGTADDAAVLSANTTTATSSDVGGGRSALHVLADQAAAFSNQEQPAAPSQTRTRTQTKGKEKERTPVQQEPSGSTPKPRRKSRSRRREPEGDTPSPAAPASRSVTPRSDAGDDQAGSTCIGQPKVGSSSEAQADPGGGTSSASTSQTLDSTGNQILPNDAPSPRSSDASLHVDDEAEVTPRASSRTQGLPSGDGSLAQPNFAPLPALEREASPLQPRAETTPPADENGGVAGLGSAAPINKELVRVAEQDGALPPKRQRSPYVKWSKEEDALLAQAVAKYGQKWDLVQKALPSRGYHQVRQRWLRKLGVFDSKPDLSSFQTAATTFPSTSRPGDGELRGNPKLGLAPLSSEKAFSAVGRPGSLPS